VGVTAAADHCREKSFCCASASVRTRLPVPSCVLPGNDARRGDTIGRIIDASCVGRPCRNDALAQQERQHPSGAIDTRATRCPPGGVLGGAALMRPASAARPPMAASTASPASLVSRPRKKRVNVGVSGATPQQVQHIPSRGQLEDISMLDLSSGEEDG
jgi:hypothetical protein